MSVVEYEVGRQPGPPDRKRIEVDPITLRVLGGAFHAIAKEMAGVLFRMSYSSIIRESEDLGAGIFDAEGRELCESDSTPMHIGSLPWYIRGFLWRLEGEIEDGDVIVHNHPYLGASHSPDVAVAVPIFHDGDLLGFAAVTAHVLDVGGSFPGINADAFDVYAEAKRRLARFANAHLHVLERTGLDLSDDASFDRVSSHLVFIHLDREDVFHHFHGSALSREHRSSWNINPLGQLGSNPHVRSQIRSDEDDACVGRGRPKLNANVFSVPVTKAFDRNGP